MYRPMNAPAVSRLAAVSAALLLASGSATPAWGFLDFFKKDQAKAPSAPELKVQEGEASRMLAEAKSQDSSGNSGKAIGIYDQILKKYPFTNSAAEAAVAKAWDIRQTGKLQAAFEA